jgi:hypothetical protein
MVHPKNHHYKVLLSLDMNESVLLELSLKGQMENLVKPLLQPIQLQIYSDND